MNTGIWLWLRHNNAPACVASSVLLAGLVHLLVSNLLETAGSTTNIKVFWVSVVAAIPLLFVFGAETEVDRAAPRSLKVRRALLVALASCTVLGLGMLLYAPNFQDFGVFAFWRNGLGLLGLALVVRTISHGKIVWLLPLTVALASFMFSWPLQPTTTQTLWGALRTPGRIWGNQGYYDASFWLCTALFTIGLGVYLYGIQLRLSWYTREANTATKDVFFAANQGRLLQILSALLMAWLVGYSANSWLGSPQLVLQRGYLLIPMYFVPLAVLLGVLCGQLRWRTGMATWEQLAPRSSWELLANPGRSAFKIILIPLGLITSIIIAISCYGAWQDGISGTIIRQQLQAALPTVLLSFVLVGFGCIVGVILGHYMRGLWVPPAAMLLTFLVMFLVPNSDLKEVDDIWAQEYGFSTCIQDEGIEVCTTTPNAGYLEPALATVQSWYADNPYAASLPHAFVLVNNPLNIDVNLLPAHAMPLMLDEQRSFTAPQELDSQALVQNLTLGIDGYCRNLPLGQHPDFMTVASLFTTTEELNDDPLAMESLQDLQACGKA